MECRMNARTHQEPATASPSPPITVWCSATTTRRPDLPASTNRLGVEWFDGRYMQDADIHFVGC